MSAIDRMKSRMMKKQLHKKGNKKNTNEVVDDQAAEGKNGKESERKQKQHALLAQKAEKKMPFAA